MAASDRVEGMRTGPKHRLDVSGMLCPVPILMTARALATLPQGDVLEVVGDDLEMLIDLPAWCEQSGNLLLEIGETAGQVRCRIERALLPPLR